MKRSPKNILFVISALDLGGAQKVLLYFVEYLSAKGYSLKVISLYSNKTMDFFNVSGYAAVEYLNLDKESNGLISGIYNNIKRVFFLRKAIFKKKPDVVVSFLNRTNVLVLLSCLGSKFPTIVTEHIDSEIGENSKIWKSIRDLLYPLASKLVVLTDRSFDYFSKIGKIDIEVIPNPVKAQSGSMGISLKNNTLVAMGRLTSQKGFDLLIRAFRNVCDEFLNWRLIILGDGPLLGELNSLAESLGISEKVCFLGAVNNVKDYLAKGSVFVLPSRYEGFPMALCEAMACGLPCIAADCPTGPREIINDGYDGVLIPPEDIQSLTFALRRLMSSPEERIALGRNALNITNRFGIEVVMKRWENLFERVCR